MKSIITFLLFSFLVFSGLAQHTFSIVAVDPVTNEVGSAGATCLTSADCGGCGGAVIISNLVPGVGAINAQAHVCIPNTNLNVGINRMKAGDTAQEILDYLLSNDACGFGTSSDRQYGIARLNGGGSTEAVGFTGDNTLDEASHLIGANYAIQGNILIGTHVLDSMEARFLRETGPLAKKLMAAMQGANIPGADSRCLNNGTSSKSSFLRVAKQSDPEGNFELDIIIESTSPGIDPIDALQAAFDTTFITLPVANPEIQAFKIYPNPGYGKVTAYCPEGCMQTGLLLRLFDKLGRLVAEQPLDSEHTELTLSADVVPGTYIYQLVNSNRQSLHQGKLILQQ